MAKRIFQIVTVAGALALTAPALAAKPAAPAKAPAKVAAGGAAQTAPKIEGIPIETDCFSMTLPGNMVPYQRIKSANKGYFGTWGFVSAPLANAKIWVRCNPAKAKVPFKTAFERSLDKMSGWVANLKKESVTFEKDDKGRPVGQAVMTGVLKSLDAKTKKSVPANHILMRTWVQYPGRNMRVSITIAVAGKHMDAAQEILEMVLKDFDVIDKDDKVKQKANVKKIQASAKQAATKGKGK